MNVRSPINAPSMTAQAKEEHDAIMRFVESAEKKCDEKFSSI